ncbi:helix-turn-helix transcriptional regulator [Lacticaseibacillus parakribbianus]|uniref:helix-turn-helix transcriptional regulator n=1 Tax=Lacticaseibacillus parakribbianus TaxID=2970927 RepID=UPI0021CB5A37|nr:AraC family transcriptional regulator [Lacticaseibacillus parakribbianus]
MPVVTFLGSALPIFLFAGRDTYAPGRAHPTRRDLGVFDLLVVSQGELLMQVVGRDLAVPAGHALLMPPVGRHAGRPVTTTTAFYWLHFRPVAGWQAGPVPKAPATTALNPVFPGLVMPQQQPAPLALTAPLLDRLITLAIRTDDAAQLAAQVTFHDLLLELSRAVAPTQNAAQRVAAATTRYLEAHFDQAITYQTLAAALNYAPSYIARCMRTVAHETPDAALTRIRLTHALALLTSSDQSIDAIARQVGYPSGNYLARRFVQVTGRPPSQFRHGGERPPFILR